MKAIKKSYLIIGKDELSKMLNSRIALGNELFSRQIKTVNDLENIKIEISKWHDFNLELLKQSFNNPENEYKQEYKKGYVHFGFLGSHSFTHNVEIYKKKLTAYLSNLEKIQNKLNFIPVFGKKQ
jgi:hypothetical protein